MSFDVFAFAISNINWIWFALAAVAAFAVGAIWYSLLFFRMWREVFNVDMPDQDKPDGWIRSFIIQFITGPMLGFVFTTLALMSWKFALFAVFSLAGLQMCALTFKYGSWTRFLKATLIESGYTIAFGLIYIVFSTF